MRQHHDPDRYCFCHWRRAADLLRLKLASAASSEPQAITAADLIAKGPGDNAHVAVSDVYILESYSYYVYEDKPNDYEKVWIPAIAMSDPWVQKVQAMVAEAEARNPENPDYSALDSLSYPSDIKLVIYSKELGSAAEVDAFIQGTDFTGLVLNGVTKLDGEEMTELKKMYPDLDTENVYLVEHNRKPKGTGTTMLMMVGGVLLIFAGPALFFFTRKGKATE